MMYAVGHRNIKTVTILLLKTIIIYTVGVVETTTPVPFLHLSTFRIQYASLYVLAIVFQ